MKLDFKKIKKFIYIVLLFMPMVVFADSGDSNDFGDFLMVHVFLTFFSYMTIISPLALILKTDKESQKEMEKTLFWVRIIIIIAIGMFAPGFGLAFDIISIFIGAFILVPKSIKVSSSREESTSVSGVSSIMPPKKVCPKCNSLINSRDLFCIKCGERFESLQNIPTETYTCPKCKRKLPPGNNFCIHCGQSVEISQAMVNKTLLKCAACNKELLATDVYCTNCGQPTKFISSPINKETLVTQDANAGTAVDANNFAYYAMDEDKILTTIIKDEIKKNGVNIFVSVKDLEKRKTVLTTLYAVILFIFISLLFFHTKIFEMFIIMLIVSFLYFGKVKKYNIIQYLKKEVKNRPDEKINYIISSILSGKISKFSYVLVRLVVTILAVAIPLYIFKEPHMIFERQDDGYVVRFYTLGLLENDKLLVIPEEYNGKPVIGIRGDVFANVFTIEEVIIPDTVQEIRGGAFKNAYNLRSINIPEGIKEIKGSTFENCYSLEKIDIPDSVTRIGGSAFRSDSSLEEVNISKDSKLEEIGSSAFRSCTSLTEITVPGDIFINERAFKDSPTYVKEYTLGESNDYDSDPSLSFAYSTTYYMNIGETEDVNPFRMSAELQNATITLVSIDKENDYYKFKLRYIDSDGSSKNFVLSKSKPYFLIDDSVAFEILDDYVFSSYDDRIFLYSYYN